MQRELTPWNWILKVLKFQNEMYKQGSKSRWKNSVICLVIMFIPTDVRVFQISVRGGGGKSPSGGESEILLEGIFLPIEGNLKRSVFDDSNLSQS